MTRILHLSDPHFGDGHHFPQGNARSGARSTLAGAIVDALERDGSTAVDHLVVSGDLFSHDQLKDQTHTQDGLKELIDALEIDPQRVLCVPGNHDLTWDRQWHDQKFRFYDEVVAGIGVVGLTEDMPHVAPFSGNGSGRPLAFVLLNSCLIENKQLAGLGEIGAERLATAKRKLVEMKVSAATHTIVAVVHHHLLPIAPREEHLYDPEGNDDGTIRRPSLMVDAVASLHGFAEMGVSLVLHGHQHKPAVLRYEDALHASPQIRILAAGSCGTSAVGVHRHFFSIETTADRATIRSFDQDDADSDRFISSPARTVELALSASSAAPMIALSVDATGAPEDQRRFLTMLNGYCPADTEGREIDALVELEPMDEDGEYQVEDNSDLYVMLLSVANCPLARQELRKAVLDVRAERSWQRAGRPQVSLLGMYDLLGNWDLAVRLRIGNGGNPDVIGKYLEQRLESAGLRRRKGRFSAKSVLDVNREAGSIRDVRAQETKPLERRTLGGTADYDRLRCQRSFVWIELGADHDTILGELAEAVERNPEVAAIVESANLSDQVLLLETFSACGQSSEIAHLNRLIEPVLASWERQKYTLTCYGYDEEPLVVSEPVPA